MAERQAETVSIDQLVTVERVGPFVTLKLPSTKIHILYLENHNWVLPLLTFPGKDL